MVPSRLALYFSAALGLAFVSKSYAQLVSAFDQGWYDETGFHDPSNRNTFTGAFGGYPLIRSFFIFNLPSLSGTAVGATLEVFNSAVDPTDPDNKGYFSPDPFETVVLHQVVTPISNLVAGTGGVAVYQDLGDGLVLGSKTVSDADNGTWIHFTLNADFLAWLNGSPAQIAIGGRLADIGDPAGFEFVFGSRDEPPLARLNIQTAPSTNAVPEPSTYGVVGGVLLVAAIVRRRLGFSS